MKRLAIFCLAVSAFLPTTLFAGGIVTNTNQSASFIRMPAQDATIGIEGVYYNPAGLVHLDNGFYISVSSQTVMQTREISSTFEMNQQKFQGDVFAPVFPTFYAVYKKDKVAYSFGVNPIGGGGSAKFEKGLASFETNVSKIHQSLGALNYRMNSSLDGSSLNWGFQFNASYALSEKLSIGIGFRYVIAGNSYAGTISGVDFEMAPGVWMPASPLLAGLSAQASGAAASIQPIITGGGGGFTLDQLVGASFITQTQADQLIEGLGAAYNPAMTATEVQGTYQYLSGELAFASEFTKDNKLDASQSGQGISPIISLNYKPSDNFNVAIKYEHKTNITLTNETKSDIVGLYPDGAKTPNDMPSLLVVGVGYRPMDKLFVTGGLHYYFDKNAKYGKKIGGVFVDNEEVMDGNSWEASLGLEYSINDVFLVSAGYLLTKTGANDLYHSDLSHSLNTSSVGFGGKYMINDRLGLNLGFMYTMYDEYTKKFVGYNESYNRKAMVGAIGFDYKF